LWGGGGKEGVEGGVLRGRGSAHERGVSAGYLSNSSNCMTHRSWVFFGGMGGGWGGGFE